MINYNMKKSALFLFGLIFVSSFAFVVMAHGDEVFQQAEEIIQQRISCDDLTEEQLEILGDYYMEQMHPGELHEIMDERMGGEGSESLRLAHIRMGEAFYCGEHDAVSTDFMSTMMGRTGNTYGGYGMMGGYYSQRGYSGVLNLLLILGVFVLIVLLVRERQGTKHKRR